MKTIIVNSDPFAYKQNIMVYIDGACVEHTQVPVNDIVNVVNGLKTKYGISQVDLCGHPEFLSRFKAQLGVQFTTDQSVVNIHEKQETKGE